MCSGEQSELGLEAEDISSASLPPPRNKAMDLLARREHSRLEIANKLAERGYTPAAIDSALDGLVADGLLCDKRFAAAFVAARARKGQGPVRIRRDLKQRGVDVALIEHAFGQADTDWYALAQDVRCRKFGEPVPAHFKQKARQMRFLEYRGFTSEQIRSAFGADSD